MARSALNFRFKLEGAFLVFLVSTLAAAPTGWVGRPVRAQAPTPDAHSIEAVVTAALSQYPNVSHLGENELTAIARTPQGRRGVIDALISRLRGSFGGAASAGSVATLTTALGKLQATEAIPLLIEHLEYLGIRNSLSVYVYPCAAALIAIGPPAGVALASSLTSSDVQRRELAAEVLDEIGSSAAMDELRRGLEVETDPWVRHVMVSALAHAQKLHPSSPANASLDRGQASPADKQHLAVAVHKLYSADGKVALQGKVEALRLANAPPMRANSIAALSRVIQEGTRGGWDPRTSTAVIYATQILAAVRASEAIPLLIENIEYYRSPVNSFSLYHYPMATALVQIGPPADAQLADSLTSKDAQRRQLAAEVLGEIATPTAQKELRRALAVERDSWVRHVLESALAHAEKLRPG